MRDELWNRWFANENLKLKDDECRPGKRRYSHFDPRIKKPDRNDTLALLQPDAVARHSFYPFIRIDIKEKRFRRMRGRRRREITIKKRPIDYSCHKDALVYSWYGTILSDLYERELKRRGIDENVIAYRSLKTKEGAGKTNLHFFKEVSDFVRGNAPCFVLALDVSKFFEEVDHGYLKRQWEYLLDVPDLPSDHSAVFRSVTRYHFVRKGRFLSCIRKSSSDHRSRIFTPKKFRKFVIGEHLQESNRKGRGIPQGSPISCILANLYMIDFDTKIAKIVGDVGGLYRRYSDDILLVFPPDRALFFENLIEVEMREMLKLMIKSEKTERRLCTRNDDHFQLFNPVNRAVENFQYLGVETDGNRLFIRHGSLARFQRRMCRQVRMSIANAQRKGRGGAPKKFLCEKFGRSKNNFLSYGKRASRVLEASSIQHQVSAIRESRRLKNKINKLWPTKE